MKKSKRRLLLLLLILLMVTKLVLNLRCQLHHIIHPYTPGITKLPHKTQKTAQKRKKKDGKKDGEPIDLDDENKKEKELSYYHMMTYKRNLNKTFHYKYFRPYSHDHQRLRMEEDCKCPIGEIHNTQCQWYDPDTINVLYTKGDISDGE